MKEKTFELMQIGKGISDFLRNQNFEISKIDEVKDLLVSFKSKYGDDEYPLLVEVEKFVNRYCTLKKKDIDKRSVFYEAKKALKEISESIYNDDSQEYMNMNIDHPEINHTRYLSYANLAAELSITTGMNPIPEELVHAYENYAPYGDDAINRGLISFYESNTQDIDVFYDIFFSLSYGKPSLKLTDSLKEVQSIYTPNK